MGDTGSHSALAPISLISITIGFVSFAFTLATFLKVFWNAILALYSAPSQIKDYLSNLKQGLLEERRHLRRVKRRMKSSQRGSRDGRGRSSSNPGEGGSRREPGGGGSRGTSRGPRRGPSQNRGYGRGKRHHNYPENQFDRDLQSFYSKGNDAALKSMRMAIRDMIKVFRKLEHPFLKPEFQNMDAQQWSNTPIVATGAYEPTYQTPYKNPYSEDRKRGWDEEAGEDEADLRDDHLQTSNRFGMEYRTCTLRERWLWLKRKDDVVSLSEGLSRIEVRRTAHEVGTVLMMVGDIGKDLEGVRETMDEMRGRLGRVVGVRRVD